MPARKLKKIAIILIAVGLVVAIAGIVGTYFNTYPGIEVERVGFSTGRYESPARRVSGLLLIPDNPIENPTPAVIFCHGLPGSKELYYGVCRELARRGLIVLAIDLREHGSTGGASDFGNTEYMLHSV